MQVDPIKPRLKAPGTKGLKLNYDALLSNVAFKFNLRRYMQAEGGALPVEEAGSVRGLLAALGGCGGSGGGGGGAGERRGKDNTAGHKVGRCRLTLSNRR